MRYHLDTIPVWDSEKIGGECLLCALERKTELQEAERCLGGSVMEPDTRIQVNEKGFCREHQRMLFSMSNRLGHALMMESHTARTRERQSQILANVKKAAHTYAEAGIVGRLSKKGAQAKEEYMKETGKLGEMAESCIMCDNIRDNMNRYIHTFFHLYKTDSEFRSRFATSKGVCLPHSCELLTAAMDELNPGELAEFADVMEKLQQANMDRIQEDISWFIKKFDYRYQNEPWKDSRDAVERTCNKLRGWCVGNEPNPDEKTGK